MIMDWILFSGLAFVAVVSALGLLFSKSAVYSALNLIINFVTVALFFLLLGAPFIAVAQVAVYAGAIMVLFLFVIMLLGAERTPGAGEAAHWQRPSAIFLGVVLFVEMGYMLFFRSATLPAAGETATSFGAPDAVAQMLFSSYLLPFEVISVLLLVAMVGAIVLTKRLKPKS